MEHEIMAVYDEVAKAFLPPFFLPKLEMGIRTFSDCINSDDHQFGAHPSDYTLFHFGQFNYETGEFLNSVAKKLHNGVELINPTELVE